MKKRTLLALGLSVVLVCSNMVTVYAAEDPYGVETQSMGVSGRGDTKSEVTGNVIAEGKNCSGVETTDTANILVNGDVSAKGEYCKGVLAADKSTATVTGTVSAEGSGSYGIWAKGSGGVGSQTKGSTVNAESVTATGQKSTGVYADNYAEVTIENDVKVSEGTTDIPDDGQYVNPAVGIETSGNAHVTVKGDVTSTGTGSVGVTVSKSGYIAVGGDITASGEKYVWNLGKDEREVIGITADGGIITVNGNVISAGTGILIRRTSDMINSTVGVKGDVKGRSGIIINDNSSITVGGTVTATDGTGLTVILENESSRGNVTIETLNAEKEGETGILLDVKKLDIDTIDDIIRAMPKINVFEINVKDNAYLGIDDGCKDDKIAGTDISKEEAMNAILQKKINYTLKTEKTSNATISLDQDRALENTRVTFYVNAADGYQVKGVSAGKATVIDNGDGSYSVIVPRGGGINISAIIEAIIREQHNGQSAVSSSETAVPVKYAVGQKQAQQIIKSVAPGGNCVVELEEFISFNRETFEALAKRPDVSLTVIYKWNGVKYKVTIPAGYNVLDLLNEDGYCGCLYLNAIFGSEVVE